MLEFEKNYIPLFLEHNESIISYIVDNKFLGSDRFGGFGHYPYRAFGLLLDLFNNEITKKVFPKNLQKILDTDFNIPKIFCDDFLVGEGFNSRYHYCISLDMTITDDSKKPVLFDNITYLHGYKGKPFDVSLKFSSEEAFILLSNILANDRSYIFSGLSNMYPNLDLDHSQLAEEIIALDKWRVNKFGKSYLILNSYAFEYLKYLKTELSTNRLSPYALLHFSGATSLSFLRSLPPVDSFISEVLKSLQKRKSLLFNQKVLYYTLLYSTQTFREQHEKAKKFLNDYRIFCKFDYDKLIAKEFPISDDLADF
ncbi:MAG: hypothetical protein HZR80_18685 [Candidatus Heimdallarchaeota archaeon]